MSEPFIGEVRIFPFNYAPRYWAFCNGQVLAIQQNLPLFSLLGTTYGGNGSTNFALPNLQGRAPVHVGSGHAWGAQGGAITHTLTTQEIPAHTHTVPVSGATPPDANKTPANSVLATAPINVYAKFSVPSSVAMNPDVIGFGGGGAPHENRQPYLALNFCIALSGIFPSRN